MPEHAVTASGELIHDFLFLQTLRVLHVCNAPSPAATSAIPIAQEIVRRIPVYSREQAARPPFPIHQDGAAILDTSAHLPHTPV
jgi:L-2-hydroxyglutarate oxidase LhgO